MVASVNKISEDEIDSDTSFHLIFEMKQNVTEIEIGVFEKMEKCVLFDAAFMVWPISSGFNFSCKDGRVTAATYNYYCPLVVNPIITNACKKLHLKCDKVPRSVFANVAMHEN